MTRKFQVDKNALASMMLHLDLDFPANEPAKINKSGVKRLVKDLLLAHDILADLEAGIEKARAIAYEMMRGALPPHAAYADDICRILDETLDPSRALSQPQPESQPK